MKTAMRYDERYLLSFILLGGLACYGGMLFLSGWKAEYLMRMGMMITALAITVFSERVGNIWKCLPLVQNTLFLWLTASDLFFKSVYMLFSGAAILLAYFIYVGSDHVFCVRCWRGICLIFAITEGVELFMRFFMMPGTWESEIRVLLLVVGNLLHYSAIVLMVRPMCLHMNVGKVWDFLKKLALFLMISGGMVEIRKAVTTLEPDLATLTTHAFIVLYSLFLLTSVCYVVRQEKLYYRENEKDRFRIKQHCDIDSLGEAKLNRKRLEYLENRDYVKEFGERKWYYLDAEQERVAFIQKRLREIGNHRRVVAQDETMCAEVSSEEKELYDELVRQYGIQIDPYEFMLLLCC